MNKYTVLIALTLTTCTVQAAQNQVPMEFRSIQKGRELVAADLLYFNLEKAQTTNQAALRKEFTQQRNQLATLLAQAAPYRPVFVHPSRYTQQQVTQATKILHDLNPKISATLTASTQIQMAYTFSLLSKADKQRVTALYKPFSIALANYKIAEDSFNQAMATMNQTNTPTADANFNNRMKQVSNAYQAFIQNPTVTTILNIFNSVQKPSRRNQSTSPSLMR